ncbi:MAG: hypothetical protein EOP83_29765, partial [Verrucomicrobiaceae bacterium]
EANDPRAHFATNGVHENGRILSMIFTATQITWGTQPARLITIRDTSEMQRAEDSAAQRRDNGVDMIGCFDLSFRLTFVNSAYARHYKLSRTEMLNRDVRDFLCDDEREGFMFNLTKLTQTAPSCRMQVQGENGDLFDWIDHAVFDAEGNPVEYQRVGRDISDAVSSLVTHC